MGPSENALPVQQPSEETVRELYFHVDNLFHTRVNFFLAAEAIGFASLATVWGKPGLQLATSAFGLAFTVLLFFSNFNLGRRLKYLMDAYGNAETTGFYRNLPHVKMRGWPRTILTLSVFVPLVAFIAWLSALCVSGWAFLR